MCITSFTCKRPNKTFFQCFFCIQLYHKMHKHHVTSQIPISSGQHFHRFTFFTLCILSECHFREFLYLNRLKHISQLKGFSPV